MATRVDIYRFADIFGDGTGEIDAIAAAGVDIGDASFDYTGGAVEDLWTLNSHGMVTGLRVQFDAVGTGASPFLVDTDYWVIVKTVNTFQLASSLANAKAGTPIEGTADSAGTWSLTVQAPQIWKIAPPATETWRIERMFLFLEDGAVAFSSANYGAIDLSAGTGVRVYCGDADTDDIAGTGVEFYMTGTTEAGAAQAAVTSNAEWMGLCFDVKELTFGSGNDGLAARWTFGHASNDPGLPGSIELRGADGDYIAVQINDDLSGLDVHRFFFHGRKV